MSLDASLTVVPTGMTPPPGAGRTVSPRDLKRRARSGRIVRDVLREEKVAWLVDDLDLPSRPLAATFGARLLGRRGSLVDAQGRQRAVTVGDLLRTSVAAARDLLLRKRFETATTTAVDRLRSDARRPRTPRPGVAGPLFVRPDFTRGLAAGGSVGHIAGVLNTLLRLADAGELPAAPTFLTFDEIPTVDDRVDVRVVDPGRRFWDFQELPYIDLNRPLGDAVAHELRRGRPAFVYHRYGLFHYRTASVCLQHQLPLVLEYNGSEVWIWENWGAGVARRNLALGIEDANLDAADLIVVVSEPLRDELRERGQPERKILVNPNGVDPDRYRPDIDGAEIRRKYDLGDRTVVGFIGTFGRWHGAEVLAAAVGELVRRRPDLRDRIAFLMVGDGPTMREVQDILRRDRTGDLVRLTGMVRQTDGPMHLAAADILASPHVPNADGTRFIGSPTKLFEYLAMGRGIVASELDQIGDVLDQDTAVLVRPGDAASLAAGIERLVDDPQLRMRLGAAARQRALERHTWVSHTRRIVEALEGVTR